MYTYQKFNGHGYSASPITFHWVWPIFEENRFRINCAVLFYIAQPKKVAHLHFCATHYEDSLHLNLNRHDYIDFLTHLGENFYILSFHPWSTRPIEPMEMEPNSKSGNLEKNWCFLQQESVAKEQRKHTEPWHRTRFLPRLWRWWLGHKSPAQKKTGNLVVFSE